MESLLFLAPRRDTGAEESGTHTRRSIFGAAIGHQIGGMPGVFSGTYPRASGTTQDREALGRYLGRKGELLVLCPSCGLI